MFIGRSVVLIILLIAGACADGVASLPPQDTARAAATFDHTAFDQLLRRYVRKDGLVDYAGLKKQQPVLDEYLKAIVEAQIAALSTDEQLAFYINAYNAYTLKLIVQHYPIASIRDIPDAWTGPKWAVGGQLLTLDEIEHQVIRKQFDEPRIHFALVCAAIGCPILRTDAYTGARLEEQLDAQMRYAHAHERWFRFDSTNDIVHLTKLYDWYAQDFTKNAPSVLDYIASYVPVLKTRLEREGQPRIEWIEYDWRLNDQAAPTHTQN